jgi:hypothetical protein
MEKKIIREVYNKTQKFQRWDNHSEYDDFSDAESDFYDTIEKARSRGMSHIGRGGERDVYSGGVVAGNNNVIKVAREGLMQNENAVEVWRNLPEDAKEHIAPILEWSDGYEWIVQRRADGRGDIEKVAEELSSYGYYVSDMNGQNVGTYKDKSVLIDLGQLH